MNRKLNRLERLFGRLETKGEITPKVIYRYLIEDPAISVRCLAAVSLYDEAKDQLLAFCNEHWDLLHELIRYNLLDVSLDFGEFHLHALTDLDGGYSWPYRLLCCQYLIENGHPSRRIHSELVRLRKELEAGNVKPQRSGSAMGKWYSDLKDAAVYLDYYERQLEKMLDEGALS